MPGPEAPVLNRLRVRFEPTTVRPVSAQPEGKKTPNEPPPAQKLLTGDQVDIQLAYEAALIGTRDAISPFGLHPYADADGNIETDTPPTTDQTFYKPTGPEVEAARLKRLRRLRP